MRNDERDTGTRADAREAASPDNARACASAVTVRAPVVIMADAPDPVRAVAPSTASISPVGSPGPLIVSSVDALAVSVWETTLLYDMGVYGSFGWGASRNKKFR